MRAASGAGWGWAAASSVACARRARRRRRRRRRSSSSGPPARRRRATSATHLTVAAAQEVESALQTLGKTWSGHKKSSATGKQALQYGQLVVPLTHAVKELSAENDTLKAALEALTARVSALE